MNGEKLSLWGEVDSRLLFEHSISYMRNAGLWIGDLKRRATPARFSLYLNEGQNPDVVIEHWGIDENDTEEGA